MSIFTEYPEDLEDNEQEAYDKALRTFENFMQSTEIGECWLPNVPLEDTGKNYFFGFKNAQQAAMIMNGPIRDPERRHLKIITLCPHEDCCNPDHLLLVTKRNALHETLKDMLGDEEDKWQRLRDSVRRFERIKETKIAEAICKLATPGLPPNTVKQAMKEQKLLSGQKDWAFNNAVFTLLGGNANTESRDKFCYYLNSQGLATNFGTLPKVWREMAIQLAGCPHASTECQYYGEIVKFVAKSAGHTKLRQQLMSLGWEVEDEDY